MVKKIIMGIILLLLCILTFFSYLQYVKKEQENYDMIHEVYRWIGTEKYGDRNPLDLGVTVGELEKNPPKVEMNGGQGLYVSVMAYNHATGNTINYEDIKELMDQGKPLEVYENYSDYLEWFTRQDTSGRYVTGYGTDYRKGYVSAVITVAPQYGFVVSSDIGSYEIFKKVIEEDKSSGNNYIEKVLNGNGTLPW